MINDKFVKLTNAVYKVLEFFPESDPLKNRAKDKALVIMEHLVSINETKRLPAGRQGWVTLADTFLEEKIKAQLLEDIDILLGYLWVGKSQGWLNSINCLIIANEYEKIKSEIKPIVELVPTITPEPTSEKVILGPEVWEPKTSPSPVLNNTEVVGETGRQKQILEYLGKNEKAQVMDLRAIFPNITKRTIRRDLDGLLEAGKITRLGEFNQVFYKIR